MADCGARERPPGHQSAQMGSHRTQGGHGVGRRRPGPFGSDPVHHRPGQPPVYETTSDGHAGWVPTKAQRPNRPLCGLPVITQAAVWGCWVGETWPRGPAVLVHCGWGQWRPLCTSHQPMRAKKGY